MSIQTSEPTAGPPTRERYGTSVTPRELAEMLASDASVRVLDVRTPGEHTTAHIRGAYNVPVDELRDHAVEIGTIRSPIVLVCQSGQRARRAETTLAASGMPYLHVLDGGMQAWMAGGFPLVQGHARISLERQVRIAAGAIGATGAFLALFVEPLFAVVPAFVGCGLVFAGLTDICGMGMLIARLPYNRGTGCDTSAMVRALQQGLPSETVGPAGTSNQAGSGGTCR